MRCPTLAVVFLIGATAAAGAEFDLAGIERELAKEPEYSSGQPRYCLLVFGPAAETRVWLVSDGKDVLHVDRDGDGDLTAEGERIEVERTRGFLQWLLGLEGDESLKVGTIAEKDGKTEHKELTLMPFGDDGDCYFATIDVAERGTQFAILTFAEEAKDAPIVHFNGPLALRMQDRSLAVDGGKAELYLEIGTPGLGEDTFVSISYASVPRSVHPVAEIEFPVAEGDPVRRKYELKQRC